MPWQRIIDLYPTIIKSSLLALCFYFWNFQVAAIDSCCFLVVDLIKMIMEYFTGSFVQISEHEISTSRSILVSNSIYCFSRFS